MYTPNCISIGWHREGLDSGGEGLSHVEAVAADDAEPGALNNHQHQLVVPAVFANRRVEDVHGERAAWQRGAHGSARPGATVGKAWGDGWAGKFCSLHARAVGVVGQVVDHRHDER